MSLVITSTYCISLLIHLIRFKLRLCFEIERNWSYRPKFDERLSLCSQFQLDYWTDFQFQISSFHSYCVLRSISVSQGFVFSIHLPELCDGSENNNPNSTSTQEQQLWQCKLFDVSRKPWCYWHNTGIFYHDVNISYRRCQPCGYYCYQLQTICIVHTPASMISLLKLKLNENNLKSYALQPRYLITSLALNDLAIGLLITPFGTIPALLHCWPYGEIFCQIQVQSKCYRGEN